MPAMTRKSWIATCESLAVTRQCELVAVNRTTVYAPHLVAEPDEQELTLRSLIDTEYTRHPFYGSRKMTVYLCDLGQVINRKRVQRLMRMLGLAGMAPGPNTSQPHPQNKVYPYLLRGVLVTRPNQVWSTDITPAFAGAGSISACCVGSCTWCDGDRLVLEACPVMEAVQHHG